MLSQVCPCFLVPATKETFLSRNKFVEYEKPTIIGSNAKGLRASAKARRQNQAIDHELEKQRKKWVFIPPSNLVVILHKDIGVLPGGVALSFGHEAGRSILHRRLGRIVERDDVNIDAVIDGSFEDVIEAMSLNASSEVAA